MDKIIQIGIVIGFLTKRSNHLYDFEVNFKIIYKTLIVMRMSIEDVSEIQ